MAVHIGSILKQYCEDNHIVLQDLCTKIGINTSTARKIFRRDRIYVDTVHAFSKALNHNFFQYFIEDLPVGPYADMEKIRQELNETKQALEEMKQELDEMKRKNESLLIENQILNKFLDKLKPT
jgi:hypothetical protein